MLALPARFAGLILAFAPLFVHRSWRHAQLLLIGAILTPGRRTVASALRIMGRAQDPRFVNVHRILTRWSVLSASPRRALSCRGHVQRKGAPSRTPLFNLVVLTVQSSQSWW